MPNNYIESIKVAIGSLLGQPSEDGDAIQMLISDHRRVDQLITEFKHAEEQEKKSICTKILLELTVHAKLEEELVYPLLRSEGEEEKDQVDEALIEHECVKYLIGELEGEGPGDDKFDAKVKVLGELVKHHVREEESEMLPELRASDHDMHELGARLANRKKELLQELQKKPTLSNHKNGKAAPTRGRNSRNGKVSTPRTATKKASAKSSKPGTSRGKATKAKSAKSATKRSSTTKASSSRPAKKTAAKSGSKSKAASSRAKAAAKTASRSSSTTKKTAASKKGAATKGRATAATSKTKSSASKARSKSR